MPHMDNYVGAFTSAQFWGPQQFLVRFIILVGTVLALLAALRSARVAFRLFRGPNLPQGIHEGTAAPLEIASFALATRNLASRLALEPAPSRVENSSVTAQMQYMLREGDVRFTYLWEECSTDIQSVKNTAVLLVMLSLLGASVQSALALIAEQGRLDRLSFFIIGAFEIAAWLRVGFAVAATLLFLSSSLERGLRRRRTEWAYLCARLKSD